MKIDRFFIKPPKIFRNFYPQALWKYNTGEPVVFLTFDDGPVPEVTPWVLDVLQENQCKATFFCVGDNVRKHPDIYQRIIADGHQVGNHTYNHLNGWKTSTNRYIDNVNECTEIKSKLFRPPYGRLSFSQYNSLKKSRKIVMWDVLTMDFDIKYSSDECFNNVKNNASDGSIIVFHDSVKAFKNLKLALPKVISYFKAEGKRFEAIKE